MIEVSRFDNEEEALATLIKEFTGKMESKVLKKLTEGHRGWDNPDFISYMYNQLDVHVKKCDWVDVANIAMFLSNFDFSCIEEALKGN